MKFSTIIATSLLSLVAFAAPAPTADEQQTAWNAISNVTTESNNLNSVLQSADLPKDPKEALAQIVKDTLSKGLGAVQNAKSKEEGQAALSSILEDSKSKLNGVSSQASEDDPITRTLKGVVTSLVSLLEKIFETLSDTLDNILHLNLIGAIVSVLSGVLAAIDIFLSNLKNNVLPAK
ncbi:putative secreted protein [Wickerhamomyces ciferrii]|uniref:Secreted protein n=1 Tax=Wickerhamomyces ciferrii (strain ATCC 14091 / BCRC 22168 / CBS 111 / JCM 3599 / NBRC 0793 / NRRL Y-1031 F-60-10) TaxID=1206466 RepID=K0KFP3_WICCF|nr:uncharacterized protein BN7_1280 [Wickerhamomyces ciferrii]CCH41741.1 putative secreted protein [Wickerhamomyces ciferrii]